MKRAPPGIRNHNPGNLRRSRDKWQGLAAEQNDREFFQFKGPCWGIRALAVTIITYADKHDLRTVREIVNRFAPPSENNTGAYIGHVAVAIGRHQDAPLNVQDYATMRPLVESIIRHENGVQPYSRAEIDRGLSMAGVEPDRPRGVIAEARNPQNIAATVTTVAAGVTATVAPIATLWDTLNDAGISPDILMWGVSIALGLVAAWLVIERLRARRMV